MSIHQWCHPAIMSSVIPLSSCLQSFPASGSFPVSETNKIFASGGQSIGASASASVLPMNVHNWFPLGWTDLISLKSYDQPREHIEKQRHYFANKGPSSQSYGFPVVIYGCESWTIKKAEHPRIDAFELWCWRRLLKVPWTAKRSNQSTLKEISPEYTLEGLMLKLKFQ